MGTPSIFIFSPIQDINPELWKEDAIASPPPINIAIPHGTIFASSHSNSLIEPPSLFFFPLETEKSNNAARIATVESLAKPLTPRKSDQTPLWRL